MGFPGFERVRSYPQNVQGSINSFRTWRNILHDAAVDGAFDLKSANPLILHACAEHVRSSSRELRSRLL